MLKKFAALTLSLLLCLSLLPSQVLAASVPEPDDPVIQVDPLDPDDPRLCGGTPGKSCWRTPRRLSGFILSAQYLDVLLSPAA